MRANDHDPHGAVASYADALPRTLSVNGVCYAYHEWGPQGGVPVVFLVYLAANLDNWDPRIVDPIARDHYVIAFNDRGVGASTGHVPGNIEEMAEGARSFNKALGFNSVDIVALSIGGMVAQSPAAMYPELVREPILFGTGPQGGKSTDRVAAITYFDMMRAALSRSDPKEFLFFNRDTEGKRAATAFVKRLQERTADRDAPISFKAFRSQLKAIKTWGRATPMDLTRITHPVLIVNWDNDRMVATKFSEDLHRRIDGSELIIHPGGGHGSILQFHERFVPAALKFLDR